MKGVPLPTSAEMHQTILGILPGVRYDRGVEAFKELLFDMHRVADLLFIASVGSNLPKKVALHNDGKRCCTYVAVWCYTEPAADWWFSKLKESGFNPCSYASQDVNPEYGDLYVWFRLGER